MNLLDVVNNFGIKTLIECLESWFNEKTKLFKVDIETFKSVERGLYLNYYSKRLYK